MTGRNEGFDERQQGIMDKAMALAGVVGFIYGILVIIYKFNKTGTIKSAYLEIALVCLMFIFSLIFYIASGVPLPSIGKDKENIKTSRKLDEREKKRINVALGMGAVMAIVYSIFVIIFTLIDTKNLESAYSLIGLVVIIGIIVIFYNIRNHEYDVPKTFLGKTLTLGNSKEDKIFRLKYYIKDAIKLGLVFLVLDILNPNRVIITIPVINSTILSYGFNSFITITLFFTMNYFWGEYNVKKRRKFDESLEDDLNEEDDYE